MRDPKGIGLQFAHQRTVSPVREDSWISVSNVFSKSSNTTWEEFVEQLWNPLSNPWRDITDEDASCRKRFTRRNLSNIGVSILIIGC